MTITAKRVKDLSIGDCFRHSDSTYRVHATFMEGYAKTRVVVTRTDPYSRMPRDLTLPNLTIVEII